MTHKIAAAFLIGALALSPGLASAGESEASLEQLVVNMANTAAEHDALARYYRAKSAEARGAANVHQSMGRSYSGGKFAQRQQMEDHCKKISDQNSATAAEYEALAKLHEEEAKKTQ